MSTYEHIERANRLRTRLGMPWRAIKYYKLAIDAASPKSTYCYQMIAVCYKMMRRREAAGNWLRLAALNARLSPDQNEGFLPCGLYRDLAGIEIQEDKFEAAHEHLEVSLDLANADKSASHQGMTIGFMGRNFLRQNNVTTALGYLIHANQILANADNRSFELYNKLDLARAYQRNGEEEAAEETLRKAYLLAKDHGSWWQKLQICVLRLGGHPLDNWIRP